VAILKFSKLAPRHGNASSGSPRKYKNLLQTRRTIFRACRAVQKRPQIKTKNELLCGRKLQDLQSWQLKENLVKLQISNLQNSETSAAAEPTCSKIKT